MPPSRPESPRPLLRLSLSALVAAAAAVGLSCGAKDGDGSSGPASSAAASAAAGTASASGGEEGPKPRKKDDDVKPLYPIDGSPPDPVAARFCAAVHDLEPRRKGECCGSPGGSGYFTGECTRVLSAAIRLNTVKLDAAAVDRCAASFAHQLEGCGWTGPSPPPLPAECEAVTTGLLGEKVVCRSSLECADGFTCQGLSTTQVGRCFAPKTAGMVCGGSVDTLAALTRQDHSADRHPECAGACARPICVDAVALGGACKVSAECGVNHTCVAGKCTDKPLPAVGQPCATGECTRGARCVKEVCIAPGPEGEACGADVECQGACDKPEGAAAGKCGKRCTVLTIPTKPAFTPKNTPPAPQPPPPR